MIVPETARTRFLAAKTCLGNAIANTQIITTHVYTTPVFIKEIVMCDYYSKYVCPHDTLTIMKKRFVLLSFLCILFVGIILILLRVKTQTIKSDVEENPSPTSQQEEKRVVWDDPAGFTFTYDPSMTIDPHAEDTENYAHVEISKQGETGMIIVWASDTRSQTISQWVSGQKHFATASTMDTTLGGQPAIKINGTETSGIISVAALYDGLVFHIDAYTTESAFLATEFGNITDSFVFKPLEEIQIEQQESGGDEVFFDEEEIVE
jgi:hypothetical protein